jgi:hypothetical protein
MWNNVLHLFVVTSHNVNHHKNYEPVIPRVFTIFCHIWQGPLLPKLQNQSLAHVYDDTHSVWPHETPNTVHRHKQQILHQNNTKVYNSKIIYITVEAPKVVLLKIQVLWDVMPWQRASGSQCSSRPSIPTHTHSVTSLKTNIFHKNLINSTSGNITPINLF